MVRKWIIMIVLSVILVFGCIFESTYVNRSFDWLINSLETIQIELAESKDKIDTEKFIDNTYNLHNEWHKKVKLLK